MFDDVKGTKEMARLPEKPGPIQQKWRPFVEHLIEPRGVGMMDWTKHLALSRRMRAGSM